MKKLLLISVLILFSCEKDPIKYSLSVRSNPIDGGLVNPASGSYEAGERVTILSQPNQFFSFKNWSGDWTSQNDQIIITMDSDKSIVANFEKLDTDGDGITDDIDLCADTDPSSPIIGPNGCEVSLFYLASNGVTIKAIDEAQVGMQQEFEGNLYTVVSENQLREMAEDGENVSYVVTSKISDLSMLFLYKGVVGDISRWDVSNVTDMSYTFAGSFYFNQNLNYWDVSNVTNMRAMFYAMPINEDAINNDAALSLTLPYSGIASAVWSSIFTQEPSLQSLLSPWVSQYAGPGINSGAVELGVAISNDLRPYVTDRITTITEQTYQQLSVQLGLSFESLASGAAESFGIPSLETSIQSGINNVLNAVEYAFESAESTYSGYFNKPIGQWNVSNVTDMGYMFFHSRFNQDITSWDVSNVISMKYMFGRTSDFNQNLSSWNVSNVTDCSGFDISAYNWDLPKPNFTNCNPN